MTILILNFDYSPLNLVKPEKAAKYVFLGKAEIIGNMPISSLFFSEEIFVRFLYYIHFQYKGELKFNRKNVFMRDNYKCVYCGTEKSLTIDHLIPKSRGGQTTYENCVTACIDCNNLKGDKIITKFDLGNKKMKVDRGDILRRKFRGYENVIYDRFFENKR